VVNVTEVVVIVGMIVIGNMVRQFQTAQFIGTIWFFKQVNEMPSDQAGKTIARATISLDSARRESWNLLSLLVSGTPAMPDVAASKVSRKRQATRDFGPSLCSDCFSIVSQESNRIG